MQNKLDTFKTCGHLKTPENSYDAISVKRNKMYIYPRCKECNRKKALDRYHMKKVIDGVINKKVV